LTRALLRFRAARRELTMALDAVEKRLVPLDGRRAVPGELADLARRLRFVWIAVDALRLGLRGALDGVTGAAAAAIEESERGA
jgi:hypothetical protein